MEVLTVPAMLRRASKEFGAGVAASFPGSRWTHEELQKAVAKRAGALREAGIGRGDRVALMCGNRPEMLETFLACGWIGAVTVPINTASMGPQIEYYLSNSGAKLLVLEKPYRSRTGAKDVWVVEESFPDSKSTVEEESVEPEDPLAILYTSGTTGPAKGVVTSHGQYFWWGRNTADILGVRAGDVLGTTLPLFHINALNTFAQACLMGGEAAYEARFSASGFWGAMRERRATVVYLLGAMVPMLLAQEESAAEKDHAVRVGLGPGVPASALEAFKARTGITLLEGYGSTETNFVIATTAESARRGIMGWVRPGFEARVAEDGELLLRSKEPLAFSSGYHGMPDKTAEAWRDGWFHTGDRVVQEPDGAFRFLDRLKDAIRRRGENISSYEVEQVLLGHPDVAAAAVYPVRSELAEDEVMAALVLREGRQLDAGALAAWCRERLPYFAVPRYVEAMADLPRTENGKVQKFRLRERGVTPSAIQLPRARRD